MSAERTQQGQMELQFVEAFHRAMGTHFPAVREAQKRDLALGQLAVHRTLLVATAEAIAVEIDDARGRVTSTEVLAEMRARGLGEALDQFDRRFMGVVFRRGWRRLGWEPTGSHCRPVAVWTRRAA